MTIHVVGLGPAGARLLTSETSQLLASGLPVILRTRHHPAVPELDPRARWQSCDDLYEREPSFDDTYAAAVERVLEAAVRGDVVYAVPGSPSVAEATVALLRERAAVVGQSVRVYPALSFVDLAVNVLGIDAGNLQVCDAAELRIDSWRPALVAQVFNRDAAGALKLQLLEVYPASHEVVLLHALGSPGERIQRVALERLDQRPFGHLDSIYVPPLDPLADLRRFDGLHEIIRRLHAPGGCPWDREQTHSSLRPHLLEETYETLEAIDSGDPGRLSEELGDLLLQVLMHAAVAEREGTFALADVTDHIGRKLIRRHPHVFGAERAESAEQVHRNWEALKKAEQPERSALEGVPASMPALAASQAIQGRARRLGFDWPDIEGPLEKLREEVGELARSEGAAERADEFGDILFVLANIGQRLGIDAEQALRAANQKFRRRFSAMERLARDREIDLSTLDLSALDALWDEAKAAEAGAAPS
jgi:tetrapyrrole methylase family protein/MazG family protein